MTRHELRRIGTILGAICLLSAIALFSAASYAHRVVHDQLAAQRLVMPTIEVISTEQKWGTLTDADVAGLAPFAGQQMVNGPQALAYANHYIDAQLRAAAAGAQVPPELATIDGLTRLANERIDALRQELRALPKNADLTDQEIAGLVNREFINPDSQYLNARQAALYRRLVTDTFVPWTAIRGVLINAHGWWLLGSMAYIAGAVAALGGLALIAYARGWIGRLTRRVQHFATTVQLTDQAEPEADAWVAHDDSAPLGTKVRPERSATG